MSWSKTVFDMEREFGSLHGDWMRAVTLRDKIGDIVVAPDIYERLDLLHVELVALTKNNVCTNEMCPHYKKICKMR